MGDIIIMALDFKKEYKEFYMPKNRGRQGQRGGGGGVGEKGGVGGRELSGYI